MCNDQYQDFTEQMTTISRQLFEQAINPDMSVSEAAAYLKENARIRTLGSVLMKYAGTEDEKAVRAKLAEGLLANHPESKVDAVARRLRDWFRNADRNVDKETAIELAFILGLDLKTADAFIATLTDEGFHWRSPRELAYIFALTHDMKYPEAHALADAAAAVAAENDGPAVDTMTHVVRAEAENIQTKDELLAYIKEAAPRLGAMHKTAHHMFTGMMEVLMLPETVVSPKDAEEEKRLTVQDLLKPRDEKNKDEDEYDDKITAQKILKVYMHREKVPVNNQNLSAVEMAVRSNWPTAQLLSQMKKQQIEVSRKVLMLLFLATDGETLRPETEADEYDDDLWFDDEDEEDDDARFRSALVRMQTMLSDCGLRGIDARIPFDWMILYCLCGADAFEVDDQVHAFLYEMFGQVGQDAEGEEDAWKRLKTDEPQPQDGDDQ